MPVPAKERSLLPPDAWWRFFSATSHWDKDILLEQASPPQSSRIYGLLFQEKIWLPMEQLIGRSHLTSGYRGPLLNKTVGGATHSAHMDGRAGDFQPYHLSLVDTVIRLSMSTLPFEKVLIEWGWIHIQLPGAGLLPARTAMMSFGERYEDGSVKCYPFNPADPRLAKYA
jgi:hypothetical protein